MCPWFVFLPVASRAFLIHAPLPLQFVFIFPGNDLNEDITPIQAGLAWTVGKRRREAFDFLGGQVFGAALCGGVGCWAVHAAN
jgi:hypothetical protein